MKLAMSLQVAVLALAGAAMIWGCCMVYVALNPGTSGEFGAYSVFFAAIIDWPVGCVSLAVALVVKKGKPALRWACLILSIASLALPFITKAAWQNHFVRIN